MISVIFYAALPKNITLSFRFENAETTVFIDLFRFAALTSTFLKKIKLVCRFSENVNIVLWTWQSGMVKYTTQLVKYTSKKKEGVETPPNN